MRTISQRLADRNACFEAYQWAKAYSDPQKAWDECPRGDWCLWVVGEAIFETPPDGPACRKAALCACDVAETALPRIITEPHRQQTIDFIALVRDWAQGNKTTSDHLMSAYKRMSMTWPQNIIERFAFHAVVNVRGSWSGSRHTFSMVGNYAGYDVSSNRYDLDALKRTADIVRGHYPQVPVGHEANYSVDYGDGREWQHEK